MGSFFIEMIVTVFCAVVASSGLWAYLQKRFERKSVKTELLLGLAHDRLVSLGTYYLDRGYVTTDEYENLHDYLYKPYEKMGGNGSGKRIMDEVKKLPMHPHHSEDGEVTV